MTTTGFKRLSRILPSAKLKLVSSAAEIMQDRPSYDDKAFAPRILVTTTFPHRQPKGNPEAWTRHNGRARLTIRPGWDEKNNKRLPYPAGAIPRLLIVYLCREAKRADANGDTSGRIDLGHSLRSFMLELGLNPANGSSRAKRSDAARLRQCMTAFFQAIVTYHEDLSRPDARGVRFESLRIAKGTELLIAKPLGQPLDALPNVARWRETIKQRPAVQRGVDLGKELRRRAPPTEDERRVLFNQTAQHVLQRG
jgi:Plasmid encoded RepA protein